MSYSRTRESRYYDDSVDRAGAVGWAALLGGEACASCERRALAAWADRMADLLSPALADHLLSSLQMPDAPLIGLERREKARLYNRFLRQRQSGALRLIRETGVGFVCLKGFALAHQVYDEPEPRIVGDIDLLLRPDDLARVTARLAAEGFAALPIPSRFGFISESSFLPILSADGQVAIDLHTAPDAWPASRALGADAVFRRSVPFKVEEMELLAPAAEHAFFL
ncbi:MAG: nucleotidyltransferase family protein, partial [Rhodospirillales bacterium]|nr:nucleotidyltransferase family protein [Rhodospirillales bacterium]